MANPNMPRMGCIGAQKIDLEELSRKLSRMDAQLPSSAELEAEHGKPKTTRALPNLDIRTAIEKNGNCGFPLSTPTNFSSSFQWSKNRPPIIVHWPPVIEFHMRGADDDARRKNHPWGRVREVKEVERLERPDDSPMEAGVRPVQRGSRASIACAIPVLLVQAIVDDGDSCGEAGSAPSQGGSGLRHGCRGPEEARWQASEEAMRAGLEEGLERGPASSVGHRKRPDKGHQCGGTRWVWPEPKIRSGRGNVLTLVSGRKMMSQQAWWACSRDGTKEVGPDETLNRCGIMASETVGRKSKASGPRMQADTRDEVQWWMPTEGMPKSDQGVGDLKPDHGADKPRSCVDQSTSRPCDGKSEPRPCDDKGRPGSGSDKAWKGSCHRVTDAEQACRAWPGSGWGHMGAWKLPAWELAWGQHGAEEGASSLESQWKKSLYIYIYRRGMRGADVDTCSRIPSIIKQARLPT
jgi:hypothetical protein